MERQRYLRNVQRKLTRKFPDINVQTKQSGDRWLFARKKLGLGHKLGVAVRQELRVVDSARITYCDVFIGRGTADFFLIYNCEGFHIMSTMSTIVSTCLRISMRSDLFALVNIYSFLYLKRINCVGFNNFY